MSRTCIIVSPYFPPSTLAGVHRARHLAKHLPAVGWTPVVVAVDEAYHEERLDPGLASLVPNSVEVVKTAALSARLCRLLGVGEISLRAWRPLRRAVWRLMETRPVDAVLITGSPYYPMLMASEIKRRFGVPVVLDFQDPWVSKWGATLPRSSKGGMAHQLAEWLEPKAVRAADFITSVSETQNEEMAARYPWLDRGRMAAIPIGGDPEDFEALRGAGGGVVLDGSKINLSYVGTVWPPAIPPLKVLLGSIARLVASRADLGSRLQINFIGTSNQPNETDRLSVMPLAEAMGISNIVHEIPERIPYLDSLSVLSMSDGLLMFGSTEPHYTASKIYSNLMTGRPFLSLFHRQSAAHSVLRASGGGVTVAFSTLAELEGLQGEICDGLERLLDHPGSLGLADRAAYRAFEASSIAGQYGRIFDGLGAERRGQG
jgi:hypothetical protein